MSRRHTQSTRRPLTVVFFALLLCVLAAAPPALAQAATSSNSEYDFDGTNYYYTLFRNTIGKTTYDDGISGVGSYGATGFGAAFDDTGVVFADMTRGSRVRKITSDGNLYTITGSSTATGCTNGAASVALFGGALSTEYVNAIIAASGGYYMADSQCSSLRFIDSATNVTTNIRTFSQVTSASRPAALAKTPYANTQDSNIYVTDTANNNIRFLSLNDPITSIEGTLPSSGGVFQPIGIALLPTIRRIVATNLGQDFISLDYTSASSSATAAWTKVSSNTTTSPLVTSLDGLQVLYIEGDNIMSMPVNTAAAAAGNATPTVVLTFTPLPTSETGAGNPETMLLFAPRTEDSYYILTTRRYAIVSATPINSSSSSSSNETTAPTNVPTATPNVTSTPTPSESSCDGVCKGAIASSVVMGCAGIVLIALMILAPANIRTAIIMVPII